MPRRRSPPGADDHAGVRRRRVLERQRGEDREADHDAQPDEREAGQVAPGRELSRDARRAGRAASAAATSARPRPTKVASRSSTASRVAGSENENASTPTKPQTGPARVAAARASSPYRGVLRYRPASIALLATLMPDGNTAMIVTAMEAEVAAASPGDRLPSVRDADGAASRRAGDGAARDRVARRARAGGGAAGRGTFVGRARAGRGRPTRRGRRCALGARAIDADALETLLRPPSPSTFVLSSGYLPPDLQPTAALGAALARAARRPGAWDRVPLEGITGCDVLRLARSARPPARC